MTKYSESLHNSYSIKKNRRASRNIFYYYYNRRFSYIDLRKHSNSKLDANNCLFCHSKDSALKRLAGLRPKKSF